MTAKRDLQRRVRLRQARTGESYTTARAHVVAPVEGRRDRPPVIPVDEMIDVAADAARVGVQCGVVMSSDLVRQVEPAVALARLRDALASTEDDPGTALLRAMVLRGELPGPHGRVVPQLYEDIQRFILRARAGIGGVSARGNAIALPVDGKAGSVMMLCHVWHLRTCLVMGTVENVSAPFLLLPG